MGTGATLMSVRSSVNSWTGFTPSRCSRVDFPGPRADNPLARPALFLTYKPYVEKIMATVSVFVWQEDAEGAAIGEPGNPNTAEWVLPKAIKRKGWNRDGLIQVVEPTTQAVHEKRKSLFPVVSNKKVLSMFVVTRSNFTCLPKGNDNSGFINLCYCQSGIMWLLLDSSAFSLSVTVLL